MLFDCFLTAMITGMIKAAEGFLNSIFARKENFYRITSKPSWEKEQL